MNVYSVERFNQWEGYHEGLRSETNVGISKVE